MELSFHPGSLIRRNCAGNLPGIFDVAGLLLVSVIFVTIQGRSGVGEGGGRGTYIVLLLITTMVQET